MDIELIEIRDFLAGYHPYDLLPRDALDGLPSKLKSSYARRGSVVVEPEQPCEFLYIIRSGAVETRSPDGHLLARLGEGEAFGIHALLAGGVAINSVTTLEDSLFYMLPQEEFERLRRTYPQFAYFFAPLGAERLREARSHAAGPAADEQINLMSVRAADLVTRAPVTIRPDDTIRAAAQRMKEDGVSCLLVCEGDYLVGILTDRDLRNRVVAEAVDVDQPVDAVMTASPVSVEADSYAFDVLLTMTRKNIRHLPVMRAGKLVGVVTSTNLVQRQTLSAVYMVGDIYKRTSGAGIAEVTDKTSQLLVHLVEAGASSHNIGHIVSSLADAATIRLLQLAEQKLGPPPVPYVWCASGSQARQEQTGLSDQDNCMVIDDSYDPAAHGAYFETLARFVCDGLNAAGYIYCPGEMMAATDTWRQPLSVWRKYFTRWIDTPEPKALMLSSVFFDLRPVRGETGLFDALQAMILEKARANRIFIAHMVGNALTHTPPLGFFRNLVLIRGGEHDSRFDIKHSGVVPIVDIARIYALEAGVETANTHERLLAGKEARVLSETGARDLLDSYEFIAVTRLEHQVRQIRRGRKPDNFMAPEDLSDFERNHLKDAFSVVKTIQSSLANTFRQ